VVKVIHQHLFILGAQRILTTIKIDERIDKVQSMEEKVKKALGE
jgi:uncharacterized protein YqgV (UPF0045/DUF77 family)